jgi:hypothetical protein
VVYLHKYFLFTLNDDCPLYPYQQSFIVLSLIVYTSEYQSTCITILSPVFAFLLFVFFQHLSSYYHLPHSLTMSSPSKRRKNISVGEQAELDRMKRRKIGGGALHTTVQSDGSRVITRKTPANNTSTAQRQPISVSISTVPQLPQPASQPPSPPEDQPIGTDDQPQENSAPDSPKCSQVRRWLLFVFKYSSEVI